MKFLLSCNVEISILNYYELKLNEKHALHVSTLTSNHIYINISNSGFKNVYPFTAFFVL